MENWKFDQPPNCGVITTNKILSGKSDIKFVSHDEDDHGWQFLDGEQPDVDSAALVSLMSMVTHDPTILEVAEMPPGYVATRERKGSKWTILKR